MTTSEAIQILSEQQMAQTQICEAVLTAVAKGLDDLYPTICVNLALGLALDQMFAKLVLNSTTKSGELGTRAAVMACRQILVRSEERLKLQEQEAARIVKSEVN